MPRRNERSSRSERATSLLSKSSSTQKRQVSQPRKSEFDSFSAERGVFMRCCEELDTPRSLCCYLLAQENSHESWSQYLSLSMPSDFLSIDQFASDYLVTSMMTKNPRLPLNLDKAQRAYDKFVEAEKICASTNLRLTLNSTTGGSRAMVPMIFPSEEEAQQSLRRILSVNHTDTDVSFMLKCRRLMSRILGPLKGTTLEKIQDQMRFGPGATSTCGGRNVLASRKFAPNFDATPRLIPFAKALTGPLWGGHLEEIKPLEFAKVITVPKNSKIDRTIAIEPHLNIYAQLGIGGYLKDILTRLGLAPRDQERNREMARKAISEGLCTMDLSMASDLISTSVISILFPEDWKQLLTTFRTDKVQLQGEQFALEKFSSMGNGFTWEMETLIFYVIIAVSTRCSIQEIGVFGDDLIFPSEHYASVTSALNLFGFSVNHEKTFWQGVFYESCGCDYYRGTDVRPFFLKKDTYEDASDFAITVGNAIRRYAHKRGNNNYCDRRFLRAWLYASRRSDIARSTHIPDGMGDDGLVKNFDESTPSRWGKGYEGFRGRVLSRPSVPSNHSIELGGMIAALHRLDHSGPRRDVRSLRGKESVPDSFFVEPVRGRRGKPQLRNCLVVDWTDLGPWL